MTKEWHGLTRLMQDALVVIEWIRLIDSAIAIKSSFELLLLASLSADYQVFTMAFIRCHGR